MEQFGFYNCFTEQNSSVLFLIVLQCSIWYDGDGMTNSVDPDQTAPQEQSDQGRHCLLRPFYSNTYNLMLVFKTEFNKFVCYQKTNLRQYTLFYKCLVNWYISGTVL